MSEYRYFLKNPYKPESEQILYRVDSLNHAQIFLTSISTWYKFDIWGDFHSWKRKKKELTEEEVFLRLL